jgi:hypothetical protein
VQTFVTDAFFDGVVNSRAIMDAIRSRPDIVSADLDTAPRAGEARPGWATIVTQAKGKAPVKHVIRMPFYSESGHMVSAAQPVELADDVAAWLSQTQ